MSNLRLRSLADASKILDADQMHRLIQAFVAAIPQNLPAITVYQLLCDDFQTRQVAEEIKNTINSQDSEFGSEIPQSRIQAAMSQFFKSINPWQDDFRPGEIRTYPKGYKPTAVRTQLSILQKHKLFSEFDHSHVIPIAEAQIQAGLPEGAEFLQVFPKPSAVVASREEKYHEADYLTNAYFCSLIEWDHFNDHMGKKDKKIYSDLSKHALKSLMLTRSALEAIERISKATPGDFLVVPMQAGKIHSQYGILGASWEIDCSENEWPTPLLIGAYYALMNPKRFLGTKTAFAPDICFTGDYSYIPSQHGYNERIVCSYVIAADPSRSDFFLTDFDLHFDSLCDSRTGQVASCFYPTVL